MQVNLIVSDTDIRESTSELYTLRVAGAEETLEAGKFRLLPRNGPDVAVRGLNAVDAPAVSTATGAVRADAKLGEWYRVPVGDRLFGWVAAGEVEAQSEGGNVSYPGLKPAALQGPPVITLVDRPGGASVKTGALTLSGEALGGRLIQDLFIYVNNKKVFFKSNSAPEADKQRMRFSARVPLEAGVNRITVIAPEDEELSSRQTLFVHREN